MNFLARDPPVPRPFGAGSPVVLWCGVSVRCVFKIIVGASKIWALSLNSLPSAGPPSAGPPKVLLFFSPLPPLFSFFLPLLGTAGPSNVHVCVLGLSCENPGFRAAGVSHDSSRTPLPSHLSSVRPSKMLLTIFLQLIGSFSPQPIETKFAGIPGKTLLLPHHPSGPTPLGLNFSGFAPLPAFGPLCSC